MLSRRQLRIKVMHALYAYFQSEKPDLNLAEKELFRGIEKSYDLYLTLFQLLLELVDVEAIQFADKPKSHLSSSRFERPKNRLGDNLFLNAIRDDEKFKNLISKRKISWQADNETVQKVFNKIKRSTTYEIPEDAKERNWVDDTDYILKIFQQFISDYDLVVNLLEEKNIYFAESMDYITSMVVKNIRSTGKSEEPKFAVFNLFYDDEDDIDFVKNLFSDTINTKLITEKYIEEKSINWDIERLAILDVIILKMAISEITRFSLIPIKVSINEYIDLAKEYSTPKSGVFVNGILDKIVAELKEQGKVIKMGRGLIE